MDRVKYDPENCVSVWLAYFDLLGTSELITSGRTQEVFHAYQEALDQLRLWGESKRHASISHAWFSDTFIMYSEDDSGSSFSAIEALCRWFAFSLLDRKIPIRGALSCGDFYSDRANSLYLGSALLEAYEWGEKQDWIGFILCPSVVSRLQALNIPIEKQRNYVDYAVPFKPGVPKSRRIYACILGHMFRGANDRNFLLDKLTEMETTQEDPRVRKKYTRTIKFLLGYEGKQVENR